MRSHNYDFRGHDLARILGRPLAVVALFTLIMHAGGRLGILPRPRPALDVDRTILIHQAQASQSKSDAEVLLIGDSSCLIDVSAVQLTAQLGRPALNLGTLSFLDLNDYAALLRRFAAANPGQLRAVVLLMHPEALRRNPGGTHHQPFFRDFLAGKDHFQPVTLRDRFSHALGLEKFRARILARAVPPLLADTYRKRFGFSENFEAFLASNRGSSIELDPKPFEGNPEYRLNKQLESASRAFKAALPQGAKLFVAITPAPERYVRRDYNTVHRGMIEQWAGWLQPDAILSELPPTMADDLFARTTHLNERGTTIYTELLAKNLRNDVLRSDGGIGP
jgi:hypothetical protein